jgi:drug/metabolite transporter (DMT)-like permease
MVQPKVVALEAGRSATGHGLGMFYGLLGVLAFSLTLPATRVAVAEIDAWLVALARAVLAAVPAAMLLAATRSPWPERGQWRQLAVVAAGVVLGFPLLCALALRHVPAAHAAVVLGTLPLATAVAATLLGGERASRRFWLCAAAGALLVSGFALRQGGGSLHPADALLFLSVAACAVGYAVGGKLARSLGGWQVISWALVLAAPVLILPTLWLAMSRPPHASLQAWLGLGYVALVSQFFGFFFWYRGLALGGVARVGQTQLLQPFLTLMAAALLLDEAIPASMPAFALAVLACVALGSRAPRP